MTERQAADEFVEGALNAALLAAGIGWGVYPDLAPESTDLVSVEGYVVYGCSTGVDERVNGRVTKWVELPYTVRATALGNMSKVDRVEAAINVALNEIFRVDQNGFRFDSIRTGPLSSVTPVRGLAFRYGGGRYLVVVRKLVN